MDEIKERMEIEMKKVLKKCDFIKIKIHNPYP